MVREVKGGCVKEWKWGKGGERKGQERRGSTS